MKNYYSEIEKKIVVENDPFEFCSSSNFLPIDIANKAETEFVDFDKTIGSGNERYQKLKRGFSDYSKMPSTVKEIIDFFYSEKFIKILENKFNLKNILPDWTLQGGGMSQSFNGGYLKVHSDFLHKRKSKHRRVLNLLLYLNTDWKSEWKGALELWDKNMATCKKKIDPIMNNCVIFRTDQGSNHGFPDPIQCPNNVNRKSIALYYYVEEKSLLPLTIKKRELFHAVWKKRPGINEPVFSDQNTFFKRLKNKFFFRFF